MSTAASLTFLLQTSMGCDRGEAASQTAVLVRVDSDLREDLASIDVQVVDERAQSLGSSYTFDLAHNYKLPLSFTVAPSPDKMSGSFLVVARGKARGGAIVVEAKGLFSFSNGRKLGVSLSLLESCRGILCSPLETCDASHPEGPSCGPIAQLATHDVDDDSSSGGTVLAPPNTPEAGAGSMQTPSSSGSSPPEADAGGSNVPRASDASTPPDRDMSPAMDSGQVSGSSNPSQSSAEGGALALDTGVSADTGVGAEEPSTPSGPMNAIWDQVNWGEALWQ